MAGTQNFVETYTSFSGSDIVCSFGGVGIGTLSGITWSVTREKAPLYTMGSANPRSFSRGKRGIAGSLIFTMFDRPSLYAMINANISNPSFVYYTRSSNVLPGFSGNNAGIVPPGQQTIDVVASVPYYSDQIPPFDVNISFLNEYGQSASRSIFGVEILNEGSGVSMDDIVIEESMTFVAREVGPMGANNTQFGGFGGVAGGTNSAINFNTTTLPNINLGNNPGQY